MKFIKKAFSDKYVLGFLFVSLMGTLLHFAYDFFGKNPLLALIAPVNESIFEHTKLLFVPLFLLALLQALFMKEKEPCFWKYKFYSILAGSLLIPVLYYTYTGILGFSKDFINIGIYYIAAALSFFMEKQFAKRSICKRDNGFFLLLLGFFYVILVLLSFFPPMLPYFKDPLNNGYGIF